MAIARYQFTVQDDAGNIQPGAEITVIKESTGAIVPLYADKYGSAPLGNPFFADSEGFAYFYVAAGTYRIDADTRTWRDVEIGSGNRYDIPFSATGEFTSNEELPAFSVVTTLTLPAGLSNSKAFCDTAPTGAVIITFKRKTGAGAWTDAFTVTFAAGQTVGTFTLAADLELAVDDRLRPVAPSGIDASFRGLAITIAANSH